MTFTILMNYLDEEDRLFYERQNIGWSISDGRCLRVNWADGTCITYAIFIGPWTRQDMCRDCGTYLELSSGNKLYKINKETLDIENK